MEQLCQLDRIVRLEEKMDEHAVPLLCDPETHASLRLEANELVNSESGKRCPIREGIPVFFESLSGSNKKYQEPYDRIAVLYDPAEALYRFIFRKADLRAEYLKELEIGAWRTRSRGLCRNRRKYTAPPIRHRGFRSRHFVGSAQAMPEAPCQVETISPTVPRGGGKAAVPRWQFRRCFPRGRHQLLQ